MLSYRFILSALSASQRNVVNCALCHRALPVFEQFPLVDGTLFLSPSRHDEIEYDVPCHLQGQTWFQDHVVRPEIILKMLLVYAVNTAQNSANILVYGQSTSLVQTTIN